MSENRFVFECTKVKKIYGVRFLSVAKYQKRKNIVY